MKDGKANKSKIRKNQSATEYTYHPNSLTSPISIYKNTSKQIRIKSSRHSMKCMNTEEGIKIKHRWIKNHLC